MGNPTIGKRTGIQTVFRKVLKFNEDRGLLAKGFNFKREAGFLLSEGLELVDNEQMGMDMLHPNLNHDELAKQLITDYPTDNLTDLDEAVIYCDTVADQLVFGIGGMLKMGLPMGEIENILHIVCDANAQKTGGTNAEGKQQKGSAFKAPDELIRERLMMLPQFKGEK